MRCPECGAENPEASKFCGLCFHRFENGETASPDAVKPPADAGLVPVAPASPPAPGPIAPTPPVPPAPTTSAPVAPTPSAPVVPTPAAPTPPAPAAPTPSAPVAGEIGGSAEPSAAAAVAAAAAGNGSPTETGDGGSEEPKKELPPEAELPEYWEQTFESLKKESKTDNNSRKITIVAVVTIEVLAMLLLVGVFLFNSAKTKQSNNSQQTESVPAGVNTGSGPTGNQSSQTSPTGLTLKLTVQSIKEDPTSTATNKRVEITGSGFKSGILVTLVSGNVQVNATGILVYDTTRLGCNFDVSKLPTKTANLVLRNTDNETVALPVSF